MHKLSLFTLHYDHCGSRVHITFRALLNKFLDAMSTSIGSTQWAPGGPASESLDCQQQGGAGLWCVVRRTGRRCIVTYDWLENHDEQKHWEGSEMDTAQNWASWGELGGRERTSCKSSSKLNSPVILSSSLETWGSVGSGPEGCLDQVFVPRPSFLQRVCNIQCTRLRSHTGLFPQSPRLQTAWTDDGGTNTVPAPSWGLIHIVPIPARHRLADEYTWSSQCHGAIAVAGSVSPSVS